MRSNQKKQSNFNSFFLKNLVFAYFFILILIMTWILLNPSPTLAEENPNSVPNIEDTESEEIELEEIIPLSEPISSLKERMVNKSFNFVQEAGHYCQAEIFKIDISGHSSAQAKIILGGKKFNLVKLKLAVYP